MIFILCAVLLTPQALSLPPLQKRYDVLNPSNHFQRLTSLIELGPRKPSNYRIIIEASSSKVLQCFYYIANGLQRECEKPPKEPIEDLFDQKNMASITDQTKALTQKLKKKANIHDHEKYVAVDILATAGMRKQTLSAQTRIWSTFIKLWRKNELDELLQLNTIQDTSGVEEGIYGCMIANVAMGYLDLSLNLVGNAKEMVGIVEIGGASAQIAVPTEKTTSFSNFKGFHSRSIPFGKDHFWEKVMEEKMPPPCQFQTVSFARCYKAVSEKISGKKTEAKTDRYYLLGGTFEHAWPKDVIETNLQRVSALTSELLFYTSESKLIIERVIEDKLPLTKESFYTDKSQQLANMDILKVWTEVVCRQGPSWPAKPNTDGYAEQRCYNSVYAYSFLKHFLPETPKKKISH